MAIDDDVDRLREQVEQLAAALDDLILEVLRDAVEQGASDRPPLERRLARARRALERAAALLRVDGDAATD